MVLNNSEKHFRGLANPGNGAQLVAQKFGNSQECTKPSPVQKHVVDYNIPNIIKIIILIYFLHDTSDT